MVCALQLTFVMKLCVLPPAEFTGLLVRCGGCQTRRFEVVWDDLKVIGTIIKKYFENSIGGTPMEFFDLRPVPQSYQVVGLISAVSLEFRGSPYSLRKL